MHAIFLRTEYLKNPLGIGSRRPRLMWNCETDDPSALFQSAYEIIAKDDKEQILWESGKTESAAMQAEWGASPVPERTRVLWSVRLYDENDRPGEWAEASFETGLDAETWSESSWITGNYPVNPRLRYPADCFRKRFSLSAESPVRKARLYITACGLYEASLNAKKAGESVLAPGHTDYRKRVQYQTVDVTELLQPGENALTVFLADGWYRGSCGAWALKNQYGTETKLLLRLEIRYENGQTDVICSDGSFEWSSDGPIRFADNKDGEIYDARMNPSYQGRAKVTAHPVVPSASDNVLLTEHEQLMPVLLTTPSGKKVLDFQQNIAGYASFCVQAKEGQKILLRFGELIDQDGEFTQTNFQCSNKKLTTPLQQVEYTCKDGLNDYKTRFAIFGFRYILVEGDLDVTENTDAESSGAPVFRPEDFTAVAVYSDMEETGRFDSSNELLNRLVDCTRWSAKNNHADLPTDCPTRERHGWTGDAQIFCRTASYLFSYAPMARKYQRDQTDAQLRNGCFKEIVPPGGIDPYMNRMDGSAGWSDAGVFIPYDIYRMYGDRKILRDNYEAIARYTRFKIGTLGKRYLTSLPTGIERSQRKNISNYGQSYGEWAEPYDVKPFSIKEFIAPHPEETTAYIALLLRRMGKIAEILGHAEDAEEFRETAKRVRKGYQALMRSPKFSLDTNRQAKLVRPLYMRLLDKEQTEYAKKRLIQALDDYGWRLGTGFLSTPLILDVLSEIDIEYAYRLLENEEMPGWLHMPKAGATTIWENWEGPESRQGIASLDHYSKGAVCEWLFRVMCGIKVSGENEFTIAPQPGGHFTCAKAEYRSIYGTVKSAWKKEDESLFYEITIPANCRAKLKLPGQAEQLLGPGVYRLS